MDVAREEGGDVRESVVWVWVWMWPGYVAKYLPTSFLSPSFSPSSTHQMLSLSLLDAVVSIDWQNSWLKFMTEKGYLQTICASVQWEDEALQKMLHPLPEALRALYIYESKMVSPMEAVRPICHFSVLRSRYRSGCT